MKTQFLKNSGTLQLLSHRGYPLSKYAKFSENLTFLTPDTHMFMSFLAKSATEKKKAKRASNCFSTSKQNFLIKQLHQSLQTGIKQRTQVHKDTINQWYQN